MRIDVRSNMDAIKRKYSSLSVELGAGAAPRALNRTIASVRVQAAQEFKKDYGALLIRVLKGQMRFIQATRSKPVAELRFSGKRFRLLNWGATQTPHGVRVTGMPKKIIAPDGSTINTGDLAHAFIETSHKGITNIWLRAGKARYPINALLAPSLGAAFVEGTVQGILERAAVAKFGVNYSHEVQFLLSKKA